MTSVERVTLALQGQKTDRAPVVPEIIQHSLEVTGIHHRQYSTDANALARAQIACQEKYGYDAVYVSSDNYILTEALGAKIILPEDEPPQLPRHLLDKIRADDLPAFSAQNGRVPVILEATRLCREHYGDNNVYIKTCIDSAPFSLAACLCGPENWMIALMDEDEEENVHALLDKCVQIAIDMGVAAAKAGAHAIAYGDSAAGLVSRDMYARFALPYARKANQAIQNATGLPVFYHICGSTRHIIDLMVETGAACLEIDSLMDMREAAKVAAGRGALEGNVSTIQAFLNGTPADVSREADALLDYFQNRGGFILGSACEIPRHSPSENVRALTLAAEQFPYEKE